MDRVNWLHIGRDRIRRSRTSFTLVDLEMSSHMLLACERPSAFRAWIYIRSYSGAAITAKRCLCELPRHRNRLDGAARRQIRTRINRITERRRHVIASGRIPSVLVHQKVSLYLLQPRKTTPAFRADVRPWLHTGTDRGASPDARLARESTSTFETGEQLPFIEVFSWVLSQLVKTCASPTTGRTLMRLQSTNYCW